MSDKWYDDALMVNRDPDWIFALNGVKEEDARKTAVDYFTAFTGYGITDLALCVYEQSSVVPCRSLKWRGDKYSMKEENGVPVDYSNLEGVYCDPLVSIPRRWRTRNRGSCWNTR